MDSRILAAAARFERDRRGERYPQAIAEKRVSAEEASVDYQCWVAIAEWLETGHFSFFHGGADPQRDDAPFIRWPELEAAAHKAVQQLDAKVTKQEAKAVGNSDELTDLYVRRARLICVHRKVQLRRQSIDLINAELGVGPQEIAA